MQGWRFLDRFEAVDRLAKRLDRLKVRIVDIEDSDSASVPARMHLSIPWRGEAEIIWHRQWWPDGMDQEDHHVALKIGDEGQTIVCIWRLLRQKLEKPLVDVVIEEIVAAVERHTRN